MKEKIRAGILGGSLQDYKRYLAGNYRGYYVTITPVNTTYEVYVNATSSSDPGNAQLGAYMQRQQEQEKLLREVRAYEHAIQLTVQAPNLLKNLPNVLNQIIEPLIQYLSMGGYTTGCECCGGCAGQVDIYEVNGVANYLCGNCAANVEEKLQANQEVIRGRKSNLIAGLVGAAIGALIGAVLWILIYKLGYIAGIAGLAIGVCAMKGYEMLGGCLDKKGVIGSVIIMIIMVYLANKLAWAWDAYDALSIYGWSFGECFQYLGEILAESDLTGSYFGDLAIGYVLTAIASGKNIADAFRASTGSYTIKKKG